MRFIVLFLIKLMEKNTMSLITERIKNISNFIQEIKSRFNREFYLL